MIKVRLAHKDDLKFLFDLKNDKDVRKWSIKSKDKIDWEQHKKWFKKHRKEIYILEDNDRRIGDFRIEGNEIAIKIHKNYRRKGYASMALSLAKDLNEKLVAKIVDGNIPSMKLFIKEDFKIVNHKTTNKVGYYILEYEN